MSAMRSIVFPTKALLFAASFAVACGAPSAPTSANAERNPRWAEPLSRGGLPNLARIEPDLYRGAQPEPEGFVALRELGVRTIVNLRNDRSDRDDVAAAGLPDDAFELVELPMLASRVGEGEVRAFLAVAVDPSKRPLFFHCRHGADRTGAMAASYRVVAQGWTSEGAIAEMTYGGFGFHTVFRGLPELVAGLDAAALREELRLER
jgi:protein tyrosine/serine phosphatase